MTTKNYSAKEFTNIVKGAKNELNGTFKSPFVICNLLNKAAKGDFAKVEGCNISRENLAKVANVVKGLHEGRYPFDICVLPKAGNGILGTFKVVDEKQCEKASLMVGEVVTYKGKDLSLNEDGFVGIFTPISLTINGIFNAFAKVAKVDIIATEKAAKETEKAAKKAAREYENAKVCIIKDYNKGLFGEAELAAKLTDLKTKYGK